MLTASAEKLVSPVALASLSRNACATPSTHWVVLLSPLSATTLGRMAHGLADGLVASTLLACVRPMVLAPAMNVDMWAAPAVQRNWRTVLEDRPDALPLAPGSGLLACDRRGTGRMAEPGVLVAAVATVLAGVRGRDLAGQRVLVSAGPTREPIDAVRFLSNPSTGRMGAAVAFAASLRGAEVVLVHGPMSGVPAEWLERLECHAVTTSAEMQAELQRRMPWCTGLVMAAAVADQRPAAPAAAAKLPKDMLPPELALSEVPDIVSGLASARREGQWVCGFAAQDGDECQVLAKARAKLERKRLDMIFANAIDHSGRGFGSTTNAGWLLTREGTTVVPLGDKVAVANYILSRAT